MPFHIVLSGLYEMAFLSPLFLCALSKNSNFATYSSIKDGRNQETI